ncbi:MAG: aldo/keto reductase family protein [Clostridia bacterium]|nr:aldo/keto reductase family protein [Clostridia bacterium]
MNYRNLGKWGLKVSEVALGSWVTNLAGTDAQALAKQTVDAAFDCGVNFFDCADAYSGGEAERFLGRALGEHSRNEYVVSTKVFFPMGRGANDWGLSRKHIIEQLDRSLKNLKLDYVDLYFCHRFDPTTPVEETMQVLSDLVQQGKILYYGVSEWSPVQITKALSAIERLHLRPMSVIQPQYHMLDRYIEDEIMQICSENGIGITPFSPLAQGLLTGKYRKGCPIPDGSRATWQADKQINRLLTEENLDKVEQLLQIANELDVPLSVLALSWILRKKEISSVITGASKPEQLRSNVRASDVKLGADVVDKIDKILDYHPFVRRIG